MRLIFDLASLGLFIFGLIVLYAGAFCLLSGGQAPGEVSSPWPYVGAFLLTFLVIWLLSPIFASER